MPAKSGTMFRVTKREPTWADVSRMFSKARGQAKALTAARQYLEAERARGRAVGAGQALAAMSAAARGEYEYQEVPTVLHALACEHANLAHSGTRSSSFDHATAAQVLAWAARIAERTCCGANGRTPRSAA